MAVFIRIFKNKWITPPKSVDEDYTGRIVVVTGATSGIGKEAVFKFAALGASKVILTARDLKKGDQVKADLEARLGRKDQLEVWALDMMSYDSVIAFAKRAEALDHLNIAILNAGARRVQYIQSRHSWEEDLQVNTLSTVLLGILLLPKLKVSRQNSGKIPVLEFVNSGLHQNAIVTPEVQQRTNILSYYNAQANFKAGSQYSFSKVFLMYATNKLAEEIPSKDIIITSICPGVVNTDLGRDYAFPGVYILAFPLVLLFMKSPDQGADMILSGTTQGESVHGRFWQHDTIQPISPSLESSQMKEVGSRVWREIIEALKKDIPDVTEALEAALAKP